MKKKFKLQSKCCKQPISSEHRYCPRCGWECYVEKEDKKAGQSKS